jgi:hypothetical protein
MKEWGASRISGKSGNRVEESRESITFHHLLCTAVPALQRYLERNSATRIAYYVIDNERRTQDIDRRG